MTVFINTAFSAKLIYHVDCIKHILKLQIQFGVWLLGLIEFKLVLQ